MSAPGWTKWYSDNHTHFLKDGVSFWWLDEGETQFYTYLWWNEAIASEMSMALPNTRQFSINRAFQPGMQRFGTTTWTGDRQNCSHPVLLSFTTKGQLFPSCDMTAPDATVLLRQYQTAVFMPIMRVHAMHGTPRFPYYWGDETYQIAFRNALKLRYQFIPHIYSLAWRARRSFYPIAVPASYLYANSAAFPSSVSDFTYMLSESILPASLCTSKVANDPAANTSVSNIPPGTWFDFNSTETVEGPVVALTKKDVALSTIILHIRAASILVLNANDNVQHTDQLGGQLLLHIYAGGDCDFALVEDDGISLDYVRNEAESTRTTAFYWSESTKRLKWSQSGLYSERVYTSVVAVLFQKGGAPLKSSQALSPSGSIQF
jgi:alpha-glucosidase